LDSDELPEDFWDDEESSENEEMQSKQPKTLSDVKALIQFNENQYIIQTESFYDFEDPNIIDDYVVQNEKLVFLNVVKQINVSEE
jgi:hypothetical protein